MKPASSMLRTAVFLYAAFVAMSVHAASNGAIRSVALVPPAEPSEYSIAHRSSVQFLIPLVATATHFDGKEKTKSFTELLKAKKPGHAELLTSLISAKLRSLGYEVTVLDKVPRRADSPDSIEYEKIPFEADIALQVAFETIGFYSGFGNSSYEPKINVNAISFTAGGKSYPYETTICYGSDARAGKEWAIASPESAKYPNFEALLADPASVDTLFRDALNLIADRIIGQFREKSPPVGAQ